MPRRTGPTKKDLILDIRANFREINIRADQIKVEESETNIRSDFLTTQLEVFRALTDTKSKNKFATGNLSRFNKQRLRDIKAQQEQFLRSQWSTELGRAEIRRRQYETLSNRVPGLSEEDFDSVRRFFSNSPRLYQELIENGMIASNQIVDMINEGLNDRDIITAIQRIEDANIDMNTLRRGTTRAFIQHIATEPDTGVEEIYETYRRV